VQAIVRQVRTVKSRGGRLRASMALLPSHDLVQLLPGKLVSKGVEIERCPMGSLWRHNRARTQETKGEAGDERFDCLYDLRDAGTHAVLNYGIGKTDPADEVPKLRVDLADARSYIRYLLATNAYPPEDRRSLILIQTELVARYTAVRNESKVTARERWMAGLNTTDSRGRRNVMAAALVSGAGIGHLLKRINEIPKIATVVDRRTLLVDRYIQEHLELYRELWDCLRMSDHRVNRGEFQRLLVIAEYPHRNYVRMDRAAALWAIERLFTDFLHAFARIIARPFCRNAAHTRRDLKVAIQLVRTQDLAGVYRRIAKIRQGIRWVFALDHLREKVITPLSFLLDHLRRKRFVLRRFAAREEFFQIECALGVFIGKVERCFDTSLDRQVKGSVNACAYEAQRLMTQDQWKAAKEKLREAAKIL